VITKIIEFTQKKIWTYKMRFVNLLLPLLLTTMVVGDTPPQLERISNQGGKFVDTHGRVRIFHGVNVDNKSEPYLPNYLTHQQRRQLSHDWGFNIVRLNFAWAAFEPTPGNYNYPYLEQFVDLVNTYAQNGMYSIVDVHQDQYAACWCGEGFPCWSAYPTWSESVYPFPSAPLLGVNASYPINPTTGGIDESYCYMPGNNGDYYFTVVTGQIFANFYDNYNGVQTRFVQMFGEIAKYFANNTNVFGYEIINEPFPGNIYDQSLGYLSFYNSTFGDQYLLQPLYDLVAAEIRKYDTEALILFEPLVTNGEVLARPSGFTHPPGGSEQSALSYHVYCDVTANYAGICFMAGPRYFSDCQFILNNPNEYCYYLFEQEFEIRQQDAQSNGVPAIVTEFGSWSGNNTVDIAVNQKICDLADVNFTSWVNWDILSLYYEEPNMPNVIVRPYARAIAGTPLSQQYNSTTLEYTLMYQPLADIWTHTEITVPYLKYPNGIYVSISPRFSAFWSMHRGVLHVHAWDKDSPIKVTISPRFDIN